MVAVSLIISWIVFAVIAVAVFICSYLFVRFYSDSYESSHLLTGVTTLNVALSFTLLMLVPVDVLNVSASFFGSDLSVRGTAIQALYFIMFISIDVLVFIVVPFCFFFFEEGTDATFAKRVLSGVKFTAAFLVVFIVVIILGFVLKGSFDAGGLGPYGEKLISSLNSFEAAADFIIACTALVGLLVWISYTAFGFSWLGMAHIKRRSLAVVEEDLEREIVIAREQRRHLNSRRMAGRNRAVRDEEQAGLLSRKERVLRHRQERLGRFNACMRSCMAVSRPVSIALGIILLAVALFVFLCILLSSIDKLSPSAFSYIIDKAAIVNPMDALLSICLALFPLDYILFIFLVLFLWFATLAGITRLGIRLAWIEIFPVRRHRTAPQGLLLCSALLMLVCVTLAFSVDTLTPKYVTFGDQFYLENNTLVRCTFSAPITANCTVSQIARIVDEVKFRFGFFADVFYWSNWVFLGCCVIGVVASICLKPHSDDAADDEY